MSNQDETALNRPALIPGECSRQVNPPKGATPFAAQMLGAGGVRRGLRGGLQVLNAARRTYLQTEWSGEIDRRPPVGLLTRRRV